MNARPTLTRRRSLQALTASLLAPFVAASRSEAAQTPAAITQRRPESRSGVLDSEADKTVAGLRAREVAGSFGVENELVVENPRGR